MEISLELIKQLREKSGAGMADCKNALVEAGGDLDKAMDILRKKGIAKAAKRSDREAGEGADAGRHLARYGYGLPPHTDVPLEAVIAAFQRHFRPGEINGLWDGECAGALAALLAPRVLD